MATSYSKNLVDKILLKIQQYEATTGRKVSRSMMDSLFRQELDVMAERDAQSRALDMQQQSLDLQKQSAEDTASAAKVSGIVGAVSTAGELALGYKYLTGPKAATPATTTTPAVGTTTVGAQPTTPAVGGQTAVTTPTTTGSSPSLTDAQMAYDTGGTAGGNVGYEAGSSTAAYNPTGSTVGNAGLGLAAGLATNYVVTQTGEGKDFNSRMADWSKGFGMTSWSDEDYASKGSATVGGLAGGGAWGAAVANIGWDIGKAIQTGKISNELLGIPFADKIFNTDLGSIFGW